MDTIISEVRSMQLMCHCCAKGCAKECAKECNIACHLAAIRSLSVTSEVRRKYSCSQCRHTLWEPTLCSEAAKLYIVIFKPVFV